MEFDTSAAHIVFISFSFWPVRKMFSWSELGGQTEIFYNFEMKSSQHGGNWTDLVVVYTNDKDLSFIGLYCIIILYYYNYCNIYSLYYCIKILILNNYILIPLYYHIKNYFNRFKVFFWILSHEGGTKLISVTAHNKAI